MKQENFLILFMHLGVVKVGLLRLAKPEVISLCLILAKQINLMLDRTLKTPIIHLGVVKVGLIRLAKREVFLKNTNFLETNYIRC